MSGWLPPDQVATTGWPVVGERGPGPDAPAAADWAFSVEGQVDAPATHRLVDLQAAPAELAMDVHCVTGWSHQAMRFTGQPLGPLLDAARPRPTARFVRFVAWSPRDHDTTLPLEDARAACWLAWAADGEPLAEVHGGPLRVVTTGRYFFKSLKWLRRIELLADDPLGFWERADGYHNHADPWPGDERYITGNLTGLALAKFMEATSFKRWHKGTIRRAPLAGWRPATRELGPLALKGCDLRGAHLAGARLAGANFSLSDLRGASLRGADLRGADLEGARLGGADLRGADLTGAALTAVAFDDATRVDGAVITGATGLLEGALAFLAARGLTPWI
ncbi:MAG: molybdopterin-dependent oxidoreductase [Myxococcales bacterium]|nr:molybdopterin-dependent oxidoreductase [Myxococcales bacterium]